MKLAFDRGGEGPSLLVLLHGLGATRHVWRNLIAAGRWKGCWLAPDLRGHGSSPQASDYSLGAHAGDVAELMQGDWRETVVVGHSMGGAVALALACSDHGVRPGRVFGIGIKVEWNPEELEGMARMASTPAKIFRTKDEAVTRYLKVAGLLGLVAPDSAEATAGVAETPTGWRLAYDPRTATIGPPPMRALMDNRHAPVYLARGTSDPMVSLEQLATYDPGARDLPGGHNVMVENPDAVWDWIESVGS